MVTQRLQMKISTALTQKQGCGTLVASASIGPTKEDDPISVRNTTARNRVVVESERDGDGFCIGHVLQPPVPQTCDCEGAVKCTVNARQCRAGSCKVDYNPEDDGIFFWTQKTCIADEVGHSFLNRMLTMKCSFSAFCASMTHSYRQMCMTAAPFVTAPTFIKWFFSWGAAFQYDFRKDVDPWCKHAPQMLAGDGTHVGVALRHLKITPMDKADDENREVETNHRRYDRVFLFQREGFTQQQLRRAREHLKNMCGAVMGTGDAVHDEAADNELLAVCPQDAVNVVRGVMDRTYPQDLLTAVADVLQVLALDNPVSNLVPYEYVPLIQDTIHSLQNRQPVGLVTALLEPLNRVSPELKCLLETAAKTPSDTDKLSVYMFVLYLSERVLQVHSQDQATALAQPVKGSYNPLRGVAYYFTETGEQVRKLPKYAINQQQQHDDLPNLDQCRKVYPQVARGGFSYMFLWFCPMHGHCYGFHLISGAEGRKDPFCSLFKYIPVAPKVVFYDNACQFSEYSLNREPAFFRETRFFHDCFHGYSHKCSKTFRARRIPSMKVNTEICEQFNAKLQCIKYTGSHLRQPKFMFLVQLVLHLWNESKTTSFNKKLDIAMQVMQ